MKKVICGGILCLVLGMAGCGSTRTTYTTDKLGTPVQTTEERSFFASENLSDHYKVVEKKSENHLAAVNAKLDALKENIAARMTTIKMSATEAVLMSVIDSMQIAAIPVDPPPDSKAPKTMADVLDTNLLGLANLGVNLYTAERANRNQSKNDGDDITVVNNGTMGDVNSKSKNTTTTLTLDNQSTSTIDMRKKYNETTPETTTETTTPEVTQ